MVNRCIFVVMMLWVVRCIFAKIPSIFVVMHFVVTIMVIYDVIYIEKRAGRGTGSVKIPNGFTNQKRLRNTGLDGRNLRLSTIKPGLKKSHN